MSYQNEPKKDCSHLKSLQAQEVRNMVRNQGKSKVGGKECTLKSPSCNDPHLQAIINDPAFTVKPIGQPTDDGKCTYELNGGGKTLKVTIC
jgi:hypothetical protein